MPKARKKASVSKGDGPYTTKTPTAKVTKKRKEKNPEKDKREAPVTVTEGSGITAISTFTLQITNEAIFEDADKTLHVTAYTNDYIFLTEPLNHIVYGYNTDTSSIMKTMGGGKGRRLGNHKLPLKSYNHPRGLTSLKDGRLVVVDSGNQRLKFVTNPTTNFQDSAPFSRMPVLKAIASYGDRIYVTAANMVRIFDDKKGLQGQFTVEDIDDSIDGIAVTEDSILVSDSVGGSVIKLDHEGNVVTTSKQANPESKITPFGLTLDPMGYLWAADHESQSLLRFDKFLNIRYKLPLTHKPDDLAFLSNNRVVVTYKSQANKFCAFKVDIITFRSQAHLAHS